MNNCLSATLLIIGCISFFSCKNDTKVAYIPIKGFNGEVKRLTTFEYSNEHEKELMIAKYGKTIPETISYYNERGQETCAISIQIPNIDDPQVCTIVIDSTFFDDYGRDIGGVNYVLYAHPKEIVKYQDISSKINALFVIIKESRVEVEEDDNLRIENRISTRSVDIEKYKKLPNDIRYYIDFSFPFVMDRVNDIINTGIIPSDTTQTIYEYDNDQIIRETVKSKGLYSETRRKYSNNNVVSETHISEKDTIERTFIYKNGKLSEEKSEDDVIRYDALGRKVSIISPSMQYITTYKDSTELSVGSYKFDWSDKWSYVVSLEKKSSDGLIVFSSTLHLEDREIYKDDAVLLFEHFRDGLIDQKELQKGMVAIIEKIYDSRLNYINNTTYSNYDNHHNPLLVVENSIYLNHRHSYFSSNTIEEDEDKKITEYVIDYYK